MIGAKKGRTFQFNLFLWVILPILHSTGSRFGSCFHIIMSFRKPYHMPFRNLIPPLTLTGCQQNLRETTRYLLARTIETSSLPTNSSRAMAFHFRQNSMFHVTLYFAQCIVHFVLSFEVTLAIQRFCIQHSSLTYATFKFSLSTINFS